MVAIVTGSGLGLERTSNNVLGSQAQLGSSNLGRSGDGVYVNAANGNLIVTNRDELLIGPGPDSAFNRTYNSQGLLNDDNGDNWRMSTHRRIYGMTGTLNTSDSTVRRTDWDGSEVVYTWDMDRSAYVSKDGAGAYDTITRANATSTTPWIWTDGDSQYSEIYDDANGGRITSRRDTERDGSNNAANIISYIYDESSRLKRVTTADANYTELVWDTASGKTNNLLMLTTSYTDSVTSAPKYLTRTRYTYDVSNRLATVIVDLTPEHETDAAGNATADGQVYITTYTYDGTSKRVASIEQIDGSKLAFTYVMVDGAYRIASFVQTAETDVTRTTSFSYNTISRTTTITDPAGVVTTLNYDSANHLIRQAVAPVLGGNEQITTYGYAGNGAAVRNLALQSQSLDHESWLKTAAAVLANDTARPAPNGAGAIAEKITFGGSGGKLVQNLTAMANGVRYIADIWVYSASATTVKWGILEGSSTPATYSLAANSWTRLRAESAFTAGSTSRRLELAGLNSQIIWATQAQVRLESDPDQYVPTTDASVTSTIQFGTTDDIAVIRRFNGTANETANNWIEREDFFYDGLGNLIRRVDGAGSTVEYGYSSANQKIIETTYLTADPDGVAGAGVASAPVYTRFVYDDGGNNLVHDDGTTYTVSSADDVAEHHLRFTVSAEKQVTEYRYNAAGQLIARIGYSGNLYTGTDFTEKALSDWVATTDRTQMNRADHEYDFRGNLVRTTTYSRTDTSGNGLTTSEWSRTDYVYDQYGKLLQTMASGANGDGSALVTTTETYAYDGLGRTIRFTDAKGVGTWTSYIDRENRTVTTLSNGLVQTASYNRAGELIATTDARGGTFSEGNVFSLGSWNNFKVTASEPGTLDGAPSLLLTVAGAASGQSQSVNLGADNVNAGDTAVAAVSLLATATSNSAAFGLYSGVTGWGADNVSLARIISGPGVLSQNTGGIWYISGLSTTVATRIELTRTFIENNSFSVLLYPDFLAGSRQGTSIVAAAPAITVNRYDAGINGGPFNGSDFDINNWTLSEVNSAPAGTIGGATAKKLTVAGPANGRSQQAVAANYFNAAAGDTVTAAISLKATANSSGAAFGIFGNDTNWNYGAKVASTARIIKGPGTLTQAAGGLWYVTGLSTTQVTRVEITRVYTQAEQGSVRLYPDYPNGSYVGKAIIAGAPSITRTPGSVTTFKYDNRGLLRIKMDPVGARTFYFYDRLGRKIGDVDQDGSVVEYKYDGANRIIATVAYANALTPGQIDALYETNLFTSNSGNPTSVSFDTVRQQAGTTSDDRWSWNIYDKASRLLQTIDAAGAIRQYSYDGAGRLLVDARFAAALSAAAVNGFKSTLPFSAVSIPAFDDAKDRRTFYLYDKDGRQIGELDEDGYLTEYKFDGAGRKVETIRYSMQAGHAVSEADRPAHWRSATFATLKTSAGGVPAEDIHNYTIYDGRGWVVATIDGEGNVTRFAYTAAGDVAQEQRGQKVAANTNYLLANLPAMPGGTIVDTTNYSYNARRERIQRQRLLSEGRIETTSYAYNSLGKLVSETTVETIATEQRTSTNRYDAKGRVIATLGGNGSAALAALGASPTSTQIDNIYTIYGNRYVYDAADQLIQKITPDGSGSSGHRTLYYYNSDGRLKYEINALGEVTEYVSNTLGDQSSIIKYSTRVSGGIFSAANAGGLATAAVDSAIVKNSFDSQSHYTYDVRGQLKYDIRPGGASDDYAEFVYNIFGEVIDHYAFPQVALTDRNTVNYNRRGLLYEQSRLFNGNAAGAIFDQNSYDAFGRLFIHHAKVGGSHGTTLYYDKSHRQTHEYDALGNYSYFNYDARNNLILSRDRTGNETHIAYDQHNRTVTTTTEDGVISSVKKNAYGQTVLITDGAGRTTSYEYDKNGNLKSVTDAAGETTNNYDNADRLIEIVDGRGAKTRYTYDAAGRIFTEVRDFGGINATTTYQYDAKGQTTRVTDARGVHTDFTYDLKGQKTRVVQDVGGLGIITDYVYRNDGKVTQMIEAVGPTSGRRTDYEYDSMGRLTREIVDPVGLNLSTRYDYDVNNNVVAITDARGSTTRFVYDRNNRQIISVSAGGEVVETGYDAEGRTIWTKGYVNRIGTSTVDSFANEVAEATVRNNLIADNARDVIHRTYYDGDGRKAYALDAESYVTRFQYDGANNIVKTIVYADEFFATLATTKTDLDATFEVTGSPPASASVTTFTYDNANRLKSTIDAEGHSESYTYDEVGNRLTITNKLGGLTTYTYDNLNRVRTQFINAVVHNNPAAGFYQNQYEYDALGNLTRQVEGNIALLSNLGDAHEQSARETKFQYDKLGRVTQKTLSTVQHYDPTSGVDILATPVETYQYDKRGNLILVTDPAGAKTHFYYDADNRKVAAISAVGQYQSWTYDGLGNVKTERIWGALVALPVLPGGGMPEVPVGEYRETLFEYDRNSRLRYRKIANIRWNGSAYVSDPVPTSTVESIYDAFGNMVQEIDANGYSVYHWYDRNGREIQKQDAKGFVTTWVRDEDGNVENERRHATQYSTTQSAADRVTVFSYDKNGRRKSESRTGVGSFTVSDSGELNVAGNDSLIQYAYNGLGLVTSKTEANGDVTSYVYDKHGRLTSQRDPQITDFNQVIVKKRTLFQYNALGNLAQMTEQGESSPDVYASGYNTADRTTSYQYGPGGRLRTMTNSSGQATTYQYDIRGNLRRQSIATIKSDGNIISFATINSYDDAGRQIGQYSTSSGSGQIDTPVQGTHYNAYGEVASKSIGGVITEQFTYDNAGRVSKTNAGDGIWKFFGYDAAGNTTLTVTSAGADLSAHTLASVLPLIGQENVNATYAEFDERGMVKQTVEEGRRLSSNGALTTITRSQEYTAFGEVLSETDSRGNTTNYLYNNMGRMIRKIAPTLQATRENGTTVWIRPTDDYYYDIAGRMVAMRDAQDISDTGVVGGGYANSGTSTAGALKNAHGGYLTTRILLSGTGHASGGDEALVTKEFRPDSSMWETRYDAFRDARIVRDGLNRTTYQNYDKMGRVTQITRPETAAGALTESYVYDGLGRRIKSWNNLYGAGDATATDYDALGRVIRVRAQGGDLTTTSYIWGGPELNPAFGAFNGWEETTIHANGLSSISRSDVYGRELAKRDLSGWRTTSFAYDHGGRLSGQNTAGTVQNFTWFNTGQLASNSGPNGTESYSYDAGGNRLSEVMTSAGGALIKNATAHYDALGRMVSWAEAGSAATPAASTATSYDAVGNIRRTQALHHVLNATGGIYPAQVSRDYWYRYDAANRVVTDKGKLTGVAGAAGTAISRIGQYGVFNEGGADLLYNLAGERVAAFTTTALTQKVQTFFFYDPGQQQIPDPGVNGYYADIDVPFTGVVREDYQHDDAGRVIAARTAQSIYTADEYGGFVSITDPSGPGAVRSSMVYDLIGRLAQQSDGQFSGGVTYSRAIAYNAKGQVASDDVSTITGVIGGGTDTNRSVTSYNYGTGSTYALGSVVSQSAVNSKNDNDAQAPDTLTSTSYAWYEGAQQASVTHDSDTGSGSNAVYSTIYNYNGIGQLISSSVNDGMAKTLAYTLDGLGQIIRRDDSRNSNPSGPAPHEVFYRFAGKQMGMSGNDGTRSDISYEASINQRIAGQGNSGIFANGTATPAAYADFSQSLDRYTVFRQGSAGGSYQVRTGDTLQSIAASLWGDGNLWYRLAEANGLSAGTALSEGQSLTLPAGVTKSTHNAGTFRPYDASEALGDTLPTTPKPPKSPKCGTFGAILQAVVAAAVTALVAMTPLAPVAPLIGNAVGQGFGMATGIQPGGFNWKSMGMTAISMGVGDFGGGFVGGALNSAATQGIANLVGLQDGFSWTQVAASAVASAVTAGVNIAFKLPETASFGQRLVANTASMTASSIAYAATRSALNGSSFGKNIIASLPSVLGQLGGSLLARGIGTAFDGRSGAAIQAAGSGDAPLAVEVTSGEAIASRISYSQLAGLRTDEATWNADLSADDMFTISADTMSEIFGDYDPMGTALAQKGFMLAMAEEAAGEAHRAFQLQAKADELAAWKQDLNYRRNSGEIVVVGDRDALQKARTLSLQKGKKLAGHGTIPDRTVGSDATWFDTLGGDLGSKDQLPWLNKHYMKYGPESVANRIWKDEDWFMLTRGTMPVIDSLAEVDGGWREVRSILQDRINERRNASGAEAMKVIFAGLLGPAAIGAAPVSITALAAGGWSTIGGLVALDGTQSALRGYAGGDFEFQSTLGGTSITYGSEYSGLNEKLGYKVDGERTYTLATLAGGSFGLLRAKPWRIGDIYGNTASASESIPKFRNLAPLDELARIDPFPLRSIQRGYTGKLEYVVLESGELVFGKAQGHINLSRGADVLAAGEAKFFEGAVNRIDNMSGHYRPTGTSAQNAAEAAFNRYGFDATGRYVERKF